MPQSRKRKYLSKLEKIRNGLAKSAESCCETQRQTKMTEFFKVLNENDLIFKENEELHKFIQHLTDKVIKLDVNNPIDNEIISSMPTLLQALIRSHLDNFGRQKHGKRYKDELLRNFSIYSRDLGGKQCFQFWSKNLPMPSLSAVSTYSKDATQPLVEGEFRWAELAEYCDKYEVEREVNCCEDGTRVKGQPEFDSTTNQIIGFVPALDKNGLPEIKSYDASSAEAIKRIYATGTISNYAYVIMAQPLADVPPFCLAAFGTDNKFTALQVDKRWKWMVQEAKKHNIIIRGFSSDGDTRLLSTMKQWTFGKTENVLPQFTRFFFSSMDVDFSDSNQPLCYQDTIHTVAKLKNQLMKERTDEIFLQVGDYVVSGSFLHILLDQESKFEHGLTSSDLLEDKMNFRAVQKISDEKS